MDTKRLAVMCDLDGTLTSCEWRRHFVTEGSKDWKGFFDSMFQDAIVPQVHGIIRGAKQNGLDVIITTARPERWAFHTALWLAEHGVEHDAIFMRKDGDFRRDDDVKEEMFRENIEEKWDVTMVIDDREMVVKRWREMGLFVVQVTDPGLPPREVSNGNAFGASIGR